MSLLLLVLLHDTLDSKKTHVLFLHHDAVDEMPQQLVRVLLRRLGILLVLQAELPQQAFRVERLFTTRAIGVLDRVELVEKDEERGGHRERRGEGVEVGVVRGRGRRERLQRRRRVGSLIDDVAQGLSRRQRLDDGVVEAAAREEIQYRCLSSRRDTLGRNDTKYARNMHAKARR